MTDDEYKAASNGSAAAAFLEAERRSREDARKKDGPVWHDIKQALGVIFGLAVMAAIGVALVAYLAHELWL